MGFFGLLFSCLGIVWFCGFFLLVFLCLLVGFVFEFLVVLLLGVVFFVCVGLYVLVWVLGLLCLCWVGVLWGLVFLVVGFCGFFFVFLC